jgi:PAS domain S-box-containing protein
MSERMKEPDSGLKEQENNFRFLFELSSDLLSISTSGGKFVHINEAWTRTLGYTLDEIRQLPLMELIHPDDRASTIQSATKLRENGAIQDIVNRYHHKDGGWRYLSWSASYRDGFIYAIARDITDLKTTEFRLDEAEEKNAKLTSLQQLIMQLATEFINICPNQIENTINRSLGVIGEFVGADRSYIFSYDWEKRTGSNTHEWCAEGISAEIPNMQDVPLDFVPDWVSRHQKNQLFKVDDVRLLPTNSEIRAILEPQGIKSLITIPMMENAEHCSGFVGFDSVRDVYIYSEREQQLLVVFAQLLVNLQNRLKYQKVIDEQIHILELVAGISGQLVNTDIHTIDQKMNVALHDIGTCFGLDRVLLFDISSDGNSMNCTFEWHGPGLKPEISGMQGIQLQDYPWTRTMLFNNELKILSDIEALDDTLPEKEVYRKQGIKSLLSIPLFHRDSPGGLLVLESVSHTIDWQESHIDFMKIIANIFTDAFSKVMAQLDMVHARQSAEDANKAKSMFLASMSHEIRTPMNGVLGFSELLMHTPINEEQKGYLELIRQSGKSLMDVINNILDLSKIESGRVELEFIPVDLKALLVEVSSLIRFQTDSKGVEYRQKIDDRLPELVLCDPYRLRQIIGNFLSNAAKFTEKGHIELESSVVHQSQETVTVRISVSDTGIGMTKDDLNHIFEAFTQAGSSITRRFGGSGLGLAIANQLARLMKSRVRVTSEPGVGSRFWLDIPFDVAAEISVENDDKVVDYSRGGSGGGGGYEGRGRGDSDGIDERTGAKGSGSDTERGGSGGGDGFRAEEKIDSGSVLSMSFQSTHAPVILIAEDTAMNLILARQLVMRVYPNATVYEVTDGRQAIDFLRTTPVDAVLMDVQMPVMNGLDAVKIMREDAHLCKIPVIALTAGALKEEQELCRQVGMNHFLAKPVGLDELRSVLNEVIVING